MNDILYMYNCFLIINDKTTCRGSKMMHSVKCNMPASQSCAVAKREKFWQATAQSNSTYKRLATTKAYKVWFSYSHSCSLANGAVFPSIWQVCLPECFTFGYWTRLWNWLFLWLHRNKATQLISIHWYQRYVDQYIESIFFCPSNDVQ